MNHNSLTEFYNGFSTEAYKIYGAHINKEKGGVTFTLFAPKAKKIEVIGEFNNWNGENHVMKKLDDRGSYTLYISEAKANDMYKYRIYTSSNLALDKSDPYAFYSELRPNTASLIADMKNFTFTDDEWMCKRSKNFNSPLNIYEMHLGSWKKPLDKEFFTYREIADNLIEYLTNVGFTHVEFLPLNEHPLDASWGYQASGPYSATSRYGTIDDLKYLINKLHNHNIGVILDFVPVHFVRDNYSLAKFDGHSLYEYDYDDVANNEWGSCNYNYYNNIVVSYLMSAAFFWLKEYHVDGLRMDAVSNIIYWQGDSSRGVNIGGVNFLKRMNYEINRAFPTAMIIAEDSSNYLKVTAPTLYDGLGFDYKWDLGWMHDTLNYFKTPPSERKYNHNLLTFSMSYFYYENFFLTLSHDEVVHGKKTIIDKLWGTYEEKFSQCKTLYTYMFTHPGKKLNFMGNEFAHFREWDENRELDWNLLKYPKHDSFKRFFRDISKIYLAHVALYDCDYNEESFKWIDADNKNDCVFSYIRCSKNEKLVVILNMSNNTYENFKIGIDSPGYLTEILNSEKDIYSGCNIVNEDPIKISNIPFNNMAYSARITLAPLCSCIFILN
ncbi:1,4-alpha-glucan branching enzyme [Clostridium sp. DSM 8431]|uniref:1,4-alpha-glucan branching protein GlgB n=1 Tax=Clostridium sp. DSM 8431 TaxID=1761781 RepID=UPI0008F020F4|nr:1,4-alpha-glucan branching protein GlgB [Clostridium sp. DSM 8431]SFU44578.1 1,4-alpha-glucan branching enzyme [Clostridium sp. DSM 8431]